VPRRDVPPTIVRNLAPTDEDAPVPSPSILDQTPARVGTTPEAASQAVAPPPEPVAEPEPVPAKPPAKDEKRPEEKKTESKPPVTAHYAVPSPDAGNQPVIAIVIDDMGLDRTRSGAILEIEGPLTVSVMTYATDLQGWVKRAHEAGHEVIAHVPMEPLNRKENAGPGMLTVAMDDNTIRTTLAGSLDKWKGYVGINNHMGSRFTLDKQRMAVVMEELKARGLFWLDSRTTNDSVGPAAAKAAGLPYVARDVFLDVESTVPAVTAQLDRLIATAKSRGRAIAIGHPHDATISVLKQVLPTLSDRGVVLVPVTEVLKRERGLHPPS